jgi:RNA-directed DNA polymerase
MGKAKPFSIGKREVWRAYKRVKVKQGGAGVDGQTVEEFEEDLSNNLYKLWNRMSSGSYFPSPVRRVEIPKPDGRLRPLGIPTVADRVAQMVVKQHLEPQLEPYFHTDSYGYRPQKSAVDAVGATRARCWRYNWAIDLDIKGFFDNIDHDLLMLAVRKHTDCKWILLYIQRWLEVSVQLPDGSLIERDKGTPQGGVISPLLANLFLHYVFDKWMEKKCPSIPFERYADDIICHCVSEQQAQFVLAAISKRMVECKLELHPEKTRIVYCKDDRRKGSYPHEKFDFLGFEFRPRPSMDKHGKRFVGFSPAVSSKAQKAMRQKIRSWNLIRRTNETIEDFAQMYNPIIRGWINYYGSFCKSVLYRVFHYLDRVLSRWAKRKYKRIKRRRRRAMHWVKWRIVRQPDLFVHWRFVYAWARR